MKNCSDTIGNRSRDVYVCSSVPQPTAPPSLIFLTYYLVKCIHCEAPVVACTSSCYFLYFRFEYLAELAYTVVWHPILRSFRGGCSRHCLGRLHLRFEHRLELCSTQGSTRGEQQNTSAVNTEDFHLWKCGGRRTACVNVCHSLCWTSVPRFVLKNLISCRNIYCNELRGSNIKLSRMML